MRTEIIARLIAPGVRGSVGIQCVPALGVGAQSGVVGEVGGHGGAGGVSGDVACFAGWFALSPFGAAILEPDLDAGFAQVELEGELFSGEDVRVGGALKSFF